MEPLSRYQWVKSINVCPQCLKRRPEKGKTTCKVCLKKRRETVVQRKAEHKCIICCEPAVELEGGKFLTLCKYHREQANSRRRKNAKV